MSELNCDDFAELVTAFLDGALARATEHRFLEHLARCPCCDRCLGQFRETIHCLGELPPETLSADARDQLLAAFRDWRNQ